MMSNSMSGTGAHKLEPRLYKRTLSRPEVKSLCSAEPWEYHDLFRFVFTKSVDYSTRFYWIISLESLKVSAVSTVSAFCAHFP